jgi:hypothetical protein
VSSCATAFANLCTPSTSDPFYFSCMKPNSLDDAQCNIMSGTAPACTDASHIGSGC